MVYAAARQVVLRGWGLSDIDAFREWLAPGQRWQETDAPYEEPMSSEHVESLLSVCRPWAESAPAQMPFRLVVATGDGEFVGTVNRYGRTHDPESVALGIGIYDPENWGLGYGSEALSLWAQLITAGEPALEELRLHTWSGNAGMCRIAQKLGFTVTERKLGAWEKGGILYDRLTWRRPTQG